MKALFIASFCLISQFAFGWGDTGHRIVGKIAENHLSPQAKQKVQGILGRESLARASTWADEVRSDPNKEYYGKIAPLHFIEIPGQTLLENAARSEKGDILSALKKYISVLRNNQSSKEAKVEALRLVVHFIGDLHQPLHVGNALDAGGNSCVVKYHGRNTNLHSLWDSGMIEQTGLSYTEYAEFLDIAPPEQVRTMQLTSMEVWAAESQVARERIYPDAALNSNGSKVYCRIKSGDKIDSKLIPNLGYEYHYEHRPLLELRLLQAGVRLAGLLNSIFAE